VRDRCSTCKRNSNCVLGDGPEQARVLCLGEAPGRDEDRLLRPFVGATGLEWNETYLPLAGLHRSEVYVTNARKCRPGLNKKPTEREALDCAQTFLPGELASVQPEVVVLMGGTACGLISGANGIDLEVEHGIPRWCAGELFGWSGWVVPMFHPALGLHDTSKMTYILEDWAGLRGWLNGEGWRWEEDSGERDYRLVKSPRELLKYFQWRHDGLVAVDTETHGGRLWSVQVSVRVGTARMVLADNRAAMRELAWLLCAVLGFGDAVLVFHNAMADLPHVQALMGHNVPAGRWRDTMSEAWNLGNLPQGLKALSYRLLGRRRLGWEEVVGPASRVVVGDWLMRALGMLQGAEVVQERVSAKTGKPLKPKVVQHPLVRVVKSILHHASESASYDVWAKVRERVGTEQLAMLEQVVGELPVKGIAHCKLQDAVEYGCSDADDTLALALELQRLRESVGAEVVEEDQDAVRCENASHLC